jgi:hypothetical protein
LAETNQKPVVDRTFLPRQIRTLAALSGEEMSSAQILVGLSGVTALLALWAAVFATRADRASRRATKLADSRWEASTKPIPRLTFPSPPGAGQPIEVDAENVGGTLAAGGLIVQSGDELYAGELTLQEKSPPRRMSFPPVVKAWQRVPQPKVLLLVVRDVGGECWDCLDGGQRIKDPAKWLAGQLRELRMQGMVDFPGVIGSAAKH